MFTSSYRLSKLEQTSVRLQKTFIFGPPCVIIVIFRRGTVLSVYGRGTVSQSQVILSGDSPIPGAPKDFFSTWDPIIRPSWANVSSTLSSPSILSGLEYRHISGSSLGISVSLRDLVSCQLVQTYQWTGRPSCSASSAFLYRGTLPVRMNGAACSRWSSVANEAAGASG